MSSNMVCPGLPGWEQINCKEGSDVWFNPHLISEENEIFHYLEDTIVDYKHKGYYILVFKFENYWFVQSVHKTLSEACQDQDGWGRD